MGSRGVGMLESLIAFSTGEFFSGAINIGKVLAGLGFVIFVHESQNSDRSDPPHHHRYGDSTL